MGDDFRGKALQFIQYGPFPPPRDSAGREGPTGGGFRDRVIRFIRYGPFPPPRETVGQRAQGTPSMSPAEQDAVGPLPDRPAGSDDGPPPPPPLPQRGSGLIDAIGRSLFGREYDLFQEAARRGVGIGEVAEPEKDEEPADEDASDEEEEDFFPPRIRGGLTPL